ncbi:helix-turn-helix domain-containing protein [Gordonia humi]|uniref:Transcriptional regulator with XRE-family HTH domain n=1 Tax=Gordonia humi TaxID=686429 RepID=A0A840EX83_9ACTN|nr:helix-turn-helix domain-containing protein [Gordonia humi]MBB4134958.1 transcriptional regulator with XRE-family HTH domain [Gordonia humi]
MPVTASDPDVGTLLRLWRRRRRFSQQELSDLSTVSTRHLSRVETGRAHPTSEMVLHLADHLDVPLADRNRLLLAAGFAPRFAEHALDDAGVAVVMDGLRALLDAHLPYPALLLDDHWDIVDRNAAVDVLIAGCAARLLEPPVNVLQLCLHPDGLAPRIGDLEQWGAHLLRRLRSRAEHTHDARHEALAVEMSGYLDGLGEPPAAGPVLTLEIDVDGTPARFFSVSARLDTATDTTLEGLHLETFLPADETTRGILT